MLSRPVWSFLFKKCSHRQRRTQELGSAGAPAPWDGAWLTARQTSSLYVLHVKFGSSASKGVRRNKRKPPKLGSAWVRPPWSGGEADPRNMPIPTCVILPNLVVLVQTVRALLSRSKLYYTIPYRLKNLTTFEGHSRSSEPTRIDTPSMASY